MTISSPSFEAKRPQREVEHIRFEGLLKNPPITQGVVGTFPNVGVMNELVEAFAQQVGTGDQLLVPPKVSSRTLDLGVRHGPEGACLPFKLLTGNLMESLENGAGMVGMITERGPCRLGLYSLGMRLLFSDLGMEPAWFDLNNADLSQGYLRCFQNVFQKAHGRKASMFLVAKGMAIGLSRLIAVESLEKERNRLLAYEKRGGSLMEIFEEGRQAIRLCNHPPTIWLAMRKARQAMRRVELDWTRETVRVVVTGEAYCVLDGFANAHVETQLARLGVVPDRTLWQTNYMLYPMHLDYFGHCTRRQAVRMAKPYLPEQIGGDCNANVGYALMAHRRGDDGMVHLKPFGCMLEFVAENMLQAVSRDTGFPILSLTLDDLAGDERVNVRLEAFVDNLFRRKRRRQAPAGGE